MDQGTLQGIGTIFAMLAFLGVCWWAFSKYKKGDFEEAAKLPFDDDEIDAMKKSSSASDDGAASETK